MDLIFDIASSTEFWRQRYPLDREPGPAQLLEPAECASNMEDVLELAPPWVDAEFLSPNDGLLHVLVRESSDKRKTLKHATHVWSGPIPEGAFYQLKPHVFIESPPFMFLHAAGILSLPRLIAFGDELCGLYSFDERQERGFRTRDVPLVTKTRLDCFVRSAKSLYGQRRALQALSYIVDNSASPAETMDEMLLCLPCRHGGYGIPQPTMNEEIPLTPEAARIAKRGKVRLDMGYADFSLSLEHLGDYDHSEKARRASDRARTNALIEMGFTVLELTNDQVADFMAFELIAKRVARIVKKPLKSRDLGPTPARTTLRRELFGWNRSAGRIR